MSARTFGITSRNVREMPMTARASSSCVTRITPICAAMDAPDLPATRIAASIGPSSRSTPMPSMGTMSKSAP